MSAWQHQGFRVDQTTQLAKRRYDDVVRVSDVKHLSELHAQAANLWPAFPENEEAMVAWLGRVSGPRAACPAKLCEDGSRPPDGSARNAAGTAALHNFTFRLAALALAAFFIPCALFTYKIGTAVSASPWCGYIYPPKPDAKQTDGYRKALRHFPSYKPLLISYGLALSRTVGQTACPAELREDGSRLPNTEVSKGEGRRARAEELFGVADKLERIDASDYMAPLFRARALAALKKWDEAADQLERGVAMAPAYREVRLFAIDALMQAVLSQKDLKRKLERVEQARVHMRYLLAVTPWFRDRFTKQLRDVGMWPEQVAAIWPQDDPASRLPRARYFASQRDWLRLDDEVYHFTDEERTSPWYAAWQGRSQLYYGDVERGLENWKKAVSARGPDFTELRRWLGAEARHLKPAVVDLWVKNSVRDIARDPGLVLQVAPWLESKGHALRAEMLMQEAMKDSSHPNIFRYAAELSSRLNDPVEALHRAKQAWNLSPKGAEWSKWLAAFEKRATEKK